MLERLLELFFHAKSGVIAGVFLIGTTGALVTATVSGGVTTITITQASASPSASASASPSHSASPTATHSASPSPSPSASPSHSPSSSPSASASACTAEGRDAADAVKKVDTAFSQMHTDLMHLRDNKAGDAAKRIVDNTDKLLKEIRQNAVKAIHATNACAKTDDDEDNDEDKDEHDDDTSSAHEGNFVQALLTNLEKLFGRKNVTVTVNTTLASPTVAPSASPSTAPTTGDANAIADDAVAAMKLAFDSAKAQLEALPTASPRAARTQEPKGTRHSNNSGKSGHNEGDD